MVGVRATSRAQKSFGWWVYLPPKQTQKPRNYDRLSDWLAGVKWSITKLWLVCAPKLLVMSNVINFFQPFEYLYICHHPMVDSLSTSTLSVGPFCLWQCLLHFCHLRPSLYMAIPPTLCKGWSGTLYCSAGEEHHKWWIAGENHHQWWSWSLQALWAPLALAPLLLALCFQNCKSMLKHMLV